MPALMSANCTRHALGNDHTHTHTHTWERYTSIATDFSMRMRRGELCCWASLRPSGSRTFSRQLAIGQCYQGPYDGERVCMAVRGDGIHGTNANAKSLEARIFVLYHCLRASCHSASRDACWKSVVITCVQGARAQRSACGNHGQRECALI